MKTPMQLWVEGLEGGYWSVRGRLKRPVNDPQICGDGFCATGVLCDLFIQHAPEAKKVKARWDQWTFVWEVGTTTFREDEQLPEPVLKWWRQYHDMPIQGIIEFNDHRWGSFKELALYLRGVLGMSYLPAR